MTNRFYSPDEQFCDTTGTPYAGGTLSFYVTGSATPLAVYSDATLSTSLGTVVTLDSAGRAGAIFLQNLTYKVTLADVNANQIWTQDPVSTSDVTTNAQFLTYAGNPNGNVAGTAGSGTVDSSVIWDRTNNILYVCTTTGNAAAAVWTAVNASSQAATPFPQGRLTPTSATPVINADASGATAIYYTPYVGNLVPIYNGASFSLLTFAELTLTLNNPGHLATSLYDVFAYSSSGSAAIATGPAWSSPLFTGSGYVQAGASTIITAGASATPRGTGAGTTQLSRINGVWVNTVSMTARNGASGSIAIPANQGTYLGTIWTDSTAGAVTCHVSYGQARKFGVWNAYNREPIVLVGGDSTASWTYPTNAAYRAANATAANTVTTLCGLPEEWIEAVYQNQLNVQNGVIAKVGIGPASATVLGGINGYANGANAGTAAVLTIQGRYAQLPVLGLQSFTAIEFSNGGTTTYTGTSASMELRVVWRG